MAKSKPRARAKAQPSLSEREKRAVMRVYESYFSNYIKGDVKAVAKVLDDEYSQVGSAESEVFFNKKDAVKFLYDTVDQVAGKVQMRNREIRIEPHKEFVLILDLSDVYVLTAQEWVFHSKFRASSFLRQKKGSWKIYHQHSSFPDIRAQEGENISIEKVALENLQLRDAVKRRTVELEQKTRDLEVEAALERIRARAMGMRNSSELAETSSVLFHQLKKLQINAIRTSVGIFDDPNEAIELWVTAISDNREVIETLNYVNLHIHPVFENLIPARRQKKSFALTKLTGNEVREYYQHHYLSLPNQKNYNETEFFYSFFFSQGTLNVVARQALTDEQCNVLTRFAAVFGLIYTRFLDLQQAEAQAREAKIEAALERIRARAMAMHSSSELMEVADVLREQMGLLGQPELETSALHFYDEEPGHIVSWRAFRLGTKTTGKISKGRMVIPNDACALVREWLELFRGGSPEYTVEVSGGRQKEWYKVLFRLAPEVGEAMKKRNSTTEPRYYHFSTFSGGALLMVAISPPSDESIYLQRRAAGVFDLAYRRFLDLKQAEALEKEARIELAMERVRARAMAMQRSEEMREVIDVVMDQFHKLGFDVDLANFNFPSRSRDWTMWLARPGYAYPELIRLPYLDHVLFNNPREAVKKGSDFLSDVLTREEGQSAMKHFFKHSQVGADPPQVKNRIKKARGLARSMVFGKHIALTISNYQGIPYTPQQNAILRRFHSVFEQCYTRFLDLQKAEAQAKEARIEAALERVRSRSMAMHHTSELQEVINTVHQQFKWLKMATTGGAFIAINEENAEELTIWGAGGLTDYAERVTFPFFNRPIYTGVLAGIKKGPGFFTEAFSREEKIEFFNHLFQHLPFSQASADRKKELLSRPGGYTRSCCVSKYTTVFIINHHGEAFSEEENRILSRFGSVFEQTYTRFLDLQKAEAQAREAQIEAALERVRASMMAMHRSDELPTVMKVIGEQLIHLAIRMDAVTFLPINTEKDLKFWTATTQQTFPVEIIVPYFDHPVFNIIHEGMVSSIDFTTILLSEEDVSRWWKQFFEHSNVGALVQSERRAYIQSKKGYASSIAFRKYSLLNITNYAGIPFSEEENNILRRFANVFEQSYTRFLDLQKAEAQSREAQIEASLERVRSKTMAMHNSEDVGVTVATLFDELVKLGVETNRCGILIFSEGTDTEVWTAKSGNNGQASLIIGHLDVTIHPMLQEVRDAWRSRQEAFQYELAGDNIKTYYLAINNHPGYPTQFDLGAIPTREIHSDYFFREGAIFAFTAEPFPEESAKIFRRFAGVFGQTYRRYLDLLKAETQAREARIEASLERVRAKAMAMHSSKDLTDSIQVFYQELLSLGLQPRRVGVALTDRTSKMARLTTLSTTEQGVTRIVEGMLKMEGHWLLDDAFTHWLNQEEFHVVLKGTEINDYYKIVRPQISYPDYSHDVTQYGYYFMFPEGNVVAWTENELAENELKIFRKFTSVISLTYKRHQDLVDAENRTQLAIREASLDRVRAEIASMRHADDLQRITPLMWRELKTLGVPFFRCGVLIINEDKQRLDYYLSTPEGYPLAALHLDFNTTIEVVQQALDHWRQQREYIHRWNKEQFVAFARSMMELGQIQTMKSYQGGDQPPESLTLQFIPFAQGMLYVGSDEALSPDQIILVHALADAFSTAYARYEDFTKLEAAKATVEKTLSELRTTQTQLVQSEKMASLGELTAGIAHEIQNPLNFVNNFSEVSKELLDEMEEELKKGNNENALQIAKDIIQNLEKINFHGKRADGIVKSMLQHSRKSTGQKEPTDINALCDEYLRLAYHGLRAKDKSFNAKFETDLDPSVGSLSVLPQEIGRVVLNLINNAFYAVSEKKKLNLDGYEPTVTVSTKRSGTQVEIHVRDNGTGIPQKALDKIFNPFFTTKPTGQGTGLGLSLSYDIVKAHDGELSVETKEGEGSVFMIQLPS